MYDDEIYSDVINSLEYKKLAIVNTVVELAIQGYFANNIKYVRLDWISILIDAFQNIAIFTKEQQIKIEQIYNKIINL